MPTRNRGPLLLGSLALLGLMFTSCGGGQTVTAVNDGGISPIGAECEERPPDLMLETFQAASAVIGQADFFSDAVDIGGNPTAATLSVPFGLSCGSLWVADTLNNRVVRFATPVPGTGAAANRVIGQATMTAPPEAGTTAARLWFPGGVHQRGDMLFVADTSNHRVLIWNKVPASNGASANVVLGHDDFTSSLPSVSPSATSVNTPLDCFAVDGKLLVTTVENRVLIWDPIPTLNNTPATLVLGQPDFFSESTEVTASGMNGPRKIWSDGVRVVVADEDNDRVLIWNTFPTSNGQAADLVLGQSDFDDEGSGIGPSNMDRPAAVDSNGSQLVVADGRNNRVLVWNTFPTTNGQPADLVLGQGDFNHETRNDGDQDAVQDATPGPRTLNTPRDVQIIGSKLYVLDSENNRILVFDG